HPRGSPGPANGGKHVRSAQPGGVGSAYPRHVRRTHHVGVETDIDLTLVLRRPTARLFQASRQFTGGRVTPHDPAAPFLDVASVFLGGRVRLSAQTDVSGQGVGGVLERLTKRRTAVSAAFEAGPHVQMCVYVYDGDLAPRRDVTEKMAV